MEMLFPSFYYFLILSFLYANFSSFLEQIFKPLRLIVLIKIIFLEILNISLKVEIHADFCMIFQNDKKMLSRVSPLYLLLYLFMRHLCHPLQLFYHFFLNQIIFDLKKNDSRDAAGDA